MFSRKINRYLKDWSESSFRKPLLIRGARQVGKTTAVRMFARKFDVFIELNMELDDDRELFERESDINRLCNLIFLVKGVANSRGRVLIFIDEIQHSERAIASLRYFHEQRPDLYVIAAGSLLEAFLDRKRIGLPVGRVSSIWMYPLDFEEFLEAAEQHQLLSELKELPHKDYLLPVINRWFRQYALIGGMPEVVSAFLKTNDLSVVRRLQADLLAAYDDDMIKYAQTRDQADAIRFIWKRLPLEVCKQVSFGGFGKSELRTESVRSAMRILELCGLIYMVSPYTTYELPALPDYSKKVKLLMLDTGLLNYLAGVQAEYFGTQSLNSIYKGAAMEHLIGQSLISQGGEEILPLSYWQRDKRGSTAEIDYVYRHGGKLIPIEVKAGTCGTLKSLHLFMEKSPQDLAIRFYDGEFRVQTVERKTGKPFTLLNIPLALIGNLREYVRMYSKAAEPSSRQ